MPILGLPLLLAGLAALPMVAGIYWLRTRHRRQDVSALFLWQSAVKAQGGGRKKSRLQTPVTLFLELLIILLLVLAATTPRVLRAGQTASVVVVLDDSYSMLAVDLEGTTARQRAIEALRDQLDGLPSYRAQLITAGSNPQRLGQPASSWPEVQALLEGWRCRASRADLRSGLTLANEIGGPRSRLLVLTDHTNPELADGVVPQAAEGQAQAGDAVSDGSGWGRLRWVAVGVRGDNVAITNAVRSHDPARGDTILVELVNQGDVAVSTDLVLSAGTSEEDFASGPEASPVGEDLEMLRRQTIQLAPKQTRRVWLRPEQCADRVVVISIADDTLTPDNRVVLMPAQAEPLGVSIQIEDETLRRSVVQAVEASRRARIVGPGASLRFTDRFVEPAPESNGSAWTVHFDRGRPTERDADPQAFLGPFVIDHEHAVAEGLSLNGLVWSIAGEVSNDVRAETRDSDRERPIVAAGNQTLLSERTLPDSRRHLTWRLWPERSTLMRSPAFPVLIWNTIEWRRSPLPGISPPNARPGVPISIITMASRDEVQVRRVDPIDSIDAQNTEASAIAAVDRLAVFTPPAAGVYEVLTADSRYRLAVNAGSATESDLSDATTESSGQWVDALALEREYRSLSWLLGLLALGTIGAHALWLGRGKTRLAKGASP
ncbi:MAG: VWA domain-containing protein [Planctomycetota bacterium]